MKKPEIRADEKERIEALREYRILDTAAEQSYDDITFLAAQICGTPIALVTMIDSDRQWFKSRYGISAPQTPREISLCAHTIHENDVFIIEDGRKDERFADHPFIVSGPKILFYAGAPLITPGGHRLGTVCVMDHKPRTLSKDQIEALRILARKTVTLLELEKAARAAKESSRLLHGVIDAFPGMMAYWRSDFTCVYGNAKYMEWFGRSRESMIGIRMEDLLGEELMKRNERYTTGVLAGEYHGFLRTMNKQDGTNTHLWVQYIPDVVDGKVVGFVSAVTDVTQMQEAQNDVAKKNATLASSAKMAALGEMAGGIAHEINTPLAIILGKSENLLERIISAEPLDPLDACEDLQLIQDTVERIAKIIKALRYFARSGDNEPLEKIRPAELVQDTVLLCQERFRHHEISLEVNCSYMGFIDCRPVQLSQVLLNLLNNSFDAVMGLPEKWVRLEVRPSGDQVEILIIDSGAGVSAEVAEKMMNPFFTTKEIGKGTGLGLSISKGIVDSHHGALFYTLEEGRTCFHMRLPIRQSKNQEPLEKVG